MESVLLAVLCLSGWFILPSCPLRQYHFVNERLTWDEAQAYCREKFKDLATIGNMTESNQLIDTVSSTGYNSEVWIGAYTKIDWKWSDGNGAEYRNWQDFQGEPNFKPDQFCVPMKSDGYWFDFYCNHRTAFICYRGTELNPDFVFVDIKMDWTSAQKHCRENFVDLATVRDSLQNQNILSLLKAEAEYNAWLGLFRDPNFYWSDQNNFSFSFWDKEAKSPIGSEEVLCGVASLQHSGKWRFLPCNTRLPFVCHGPTVERQVLKLRIKVDDSSVDPNDPAVKADLLKKFQDKLKEKGLDGVTLVWRKQPDGKVFHKEGEKSQKMERKKTEL